MRNILHVGEDVGENAGDGVQNNDWNGIHLVLVDNDVIEFVAGKFDTYIVVVDFDIPLVIL